MMKDLAGVTRGPATGTADEIPRRLRLLGMTFGLSLLGTTPVDEPAGSFSLVDVAMASRLLDRSPPRAGRVLGHG